MAKGRLRLCNHPDRLAAKRFLLIEDWLELIAKGKQGYVNKMIEMCKDLHEQGLETRFKKHLFGPAYELKSRTPLGGARVYFFVTDQNDYVLVHAECKKENQANMNLLNDVAEVITAYESETPGLLNPQKRRPQ
jgi:hypothetical protein